MWGTKKRGPVSEPEDHALGRSRGGFGTKVHLVTDGKGIPLGVVVSPGQSHESRFFAAALGAVRVPQRGPGRPRLWPDAIAGDRGYSFGWIRKWLHRRKVEPVIPQRKNQAGRKGGCRLFDSEKYRARNVVERAVCVLKEWRRVGTRYDKLAINYSGMIDAAIIAILLRRLG